MPDAAPARSFADAVRGALLGTAVGDALGMPVEGLSHQNVRTYYKGIKAYRADENRGDLGAGQWTDDTQLTFALARALTDAPDAPDAWPARAAEGYVALLPRARRWGRTTTAAVERLADGAAPPAAADPEGRASNGAAMRAAPLGCWWAAPGAARTDAFAALAPVLRVTHAHPAALAAGLGQAWAVRWACAHDGGVRFDRAAFWADLVAATHEAETYLAGVLPGMADDGPDRRVSARLRGLADQLRAFPLDLRDACGGVGVAADEAWPFAVAMFARNAPVLEGSLLSAINVGGDADTVGAMLGALLGALHGWSAFPDEWKDGLEAADRLATEANAFADALEGV
jgi:ADP-ribosylglycohydrolase